MSDYDTSRCRLFPTLPVTTSLEEYPLHGCEFRLAVSPDGAVGLICGALGSDGRNTVWLGREDARTLLSQLQDALEMRPARRALNPFTDIFGGQSGTRRHPALKTGDITPEGYLLCGQDIGPGRLLPSPATDSGDERWCPRTEQWVAVSETRPPANLDDCS